MAVVDDGLESALVEADTDEAAVRLCYCLLLFCCCLLRRPLIRRRPATPGRLTFAVPIFKEGAFALGFRVGPILQEMSRVAVSVACPRVDLWARAHFCPRLREGDIAVVRLRYYAVFALFCCCRGLVALQ